MYIMNRKSYLITELFYILCISFALLRGITSCSCRLQSPQVSYCNADWVSHLKILNVHAKPKLPPNFNSAALPSNIRYDVKNIEIFKTPMIENSTVILPNTVFTPSDDAICRINLEANHEYLLSGRYLNGTLITYLCGQILFDDLKKSRYKNVLEWHEVPESLIDRLSNESNVINSDNLLLRPPTTSIPGTPTTTAKMTRIEGDTSSSLAEIREMLTKNAPSKINGPMAAMMQLMLVIVEQQQQLIEQQQQAINALQETLGEKRILTNDNDSDPAEVKERARSIVISGLPEMEGKPSTRAKADKQKLIELFDELDVEAEVVTTFRMGTKINGRPRLAKVVLANSKQQKSVMMAAKKLKMSAALKGVLVRPNLTKAERDEDYALRKEVRERRAKGERVRISSWPGQKREIVEIPSGN